MINVRPLNPVYVAGDPDTSIAHFKDSEWWSLINLVRQYGFEPPDIQRYYPEVYEHPVQIDPEASRALWGAISVVYNEEVSRPSRTIPPPYLEELMRCAQIGAEHGGIEIRRERENR